MKCKAGIAWDSEGFINKYIAGCGTSCEPVTPQMLGAPYYRGNFNALVIPTGFGNSMYSSILPALRASCGRIEKFVKKGGRVIAFGAMTNDSDSYNWLPFKCEYVHEYFSASVSDDDAGEFHGFLEDFDASNIECDGYFKTKDVDFDVIAKTEDEKAVMIAKKYGDGYYLVTSVHELPSKSFIRKFCSGNVEILF